MGNICRACLNKGKKIKLKKEDCIYYEYEAECSECKKIKHIVRGLKMSGKLKGMMNFKR